MKIKSLNSSGFAHLLMLLLVVVGVAIAGSYAILKSHAASSQISCYYTGRIDRWGRHYNCNFYMTSPVYSGWGSNRRIGTIHAGTNWVVCQQWGTVYHRGPYYNGWWAYTLSDQGQGGWVNAVYASGGVNNSGFGGVESCNYKKGTPPNVSAG